MANLHEMHSFITKEINNRYTKNTILQNYKKILVTMLPVIPHLANEGLSDLKIYNDIHWPKYDEQLIIEKTISYVIQINGKKRALIETERDINEENLMKIVLENQSIKRHMENNEIKRKIFVPNKLINIII